MKKLTYDEIRSIVLRKFDEERRARRKREIKYKAFFGSDYEGEEPEATKLAKKLCEENDVPYTPDLVDFTCLMEIGF